MHDAPELCFGPFRIDVQDERLWQGAQALRLRPKSFAVLRYLLERPGRLVTKEELLDGVWPGTAVGEDTVVACLREIRRALGDEPRRPQYIETVHRRGYRFIAPVLGAGASAERPTAGRAESGRSGVHRPPSTRRSARAVVGREAELEHLHACLAQARSGQRQVVFVTGEAGIGKTTLVDALLEQAAVTEGLWLARGECLEHYGAGEPYLPVLAALGRLCRAPGGTRLVDLLRQQAPTWLVQMPALLSEAELEAVQRRVAGATQARMLRELAEALETITAEQPLLLVLEDLHWSDEATLVLLAYLGRRREPARLLLVGTYRPVDVILRAHPLKAVKQDLEVHGQCEELALELLTETEVAQYLAVRLAGEARTASGIDPLARTLHQRTDGHPLFLVTVVDALVRRGVVAAGRWEGETAVEAVAREVPESLRQMIEQQLDGLSPEEQRLLEAASVAGMEWSVAAVAAGLQDEVEAVEQRCVHLARRGQFLQTSGVEAWPDGTVAGRYVFRHALYSQVVYERVPVGQGMRLHRRIGARLEVGYGEHTAERAAELALHFERGRDDGRAVQYRQQAATAALQRWAYLEATSHLTTAIALLTTLPESMARSQQELDLQMALGPALLAIKGSAAPEVEQTYARARVLCEQIGETPQLFPALRGLCWFYQSRGALQTARALGEQLYQLAQHEAAPTSLLEAHQALGTISFLMGEYAAALAHLEQGIALTDLTEQPALVLRQSVAPRVWCLAYTALALWCVGAPAQALRRSQEALALAQELAHPHSLAVAWFYAAYLYHRRREAAAVAAHAEALLALATAQGFALLAGYGACWRGWALATQGQATAGLAQLHQGMEAVLATGQMVSQSLCLLLRAEVAGHTGQPEEGLHLLAGALRAFEASGRGDLLAEAYRLQGELLLAQAGTGPQAAGPQLQAVQACFQQALTIAQRQQAKSWELRAAISLSRLWQRQGERDEARALLAPIYGWFTEGFDTPDLQEAKALLYALGSVP